MELLQFLWLNFDRSTSLQTWNKPCMCKWTNRAVFWVTERFFCYCPCLCQRISVHNYFICCHLEGWTVYTLLTVLHYRIWVHVLCLFSIHPLPTQDFVFSRYSCACPLTIVSLLILSTDSCDFLCKLPTSVSEKSVLFIIYLILNSTRTFHSSGGKVPKSVPLVNCLSQSALTGNLIN